MTTPAKTCPWWCTDHRSGATVEDEQHARLFPAVENSWIAILCGVLPTDSVELAYSVEAYGNDSTAAHEFAAALADAADFFEAMTSGRAPREGDGSVVL